MTISETRSPRVAATGAVPRSAGVSPTALVAGACLVLLGARIGIYRGVTIGVLAAVVLLPVWWRSATRYALFPWLAGVVGFALGMGYWLTALASSTSPTSGREAFVASMIVVELFLGIGVVLWARESIPTPLVAVLFGIGILFGHAAPEPGQSIWRFEYATPITLIVLGLAWYSGRVWVQVVACSGLVLISALNGGRSATAILLLALLVVVAQAWSPANGRTGSRLRAGSITLLLVLALFNVGQSLILDGALGEAAEDRTQAQIDQSGSVILGGRPELGASIALFKFQPIGFGSGTSPTTQTILVAKSGMADLGYDPNNGYVERYMLGTGGYVLHSVLADFWARYGFGGIALAVTLFVVTVNGYLRRLAARDSPALLTFLAVANLWNLAFSPSYTSAPLIVMGVGLLMWQRTVKTTDHGAPGLTGLVPRS